MVTQRESSQTAYVQLIEVLERYTQIYRGLIQTAEEKRRLLIRSQDHELKELAAREDALLAQFSQCEKLRKQAAVKLQEAVGRKVDEEASLSALQLILENEQQANQLRMIQQQLQQLAKQLHDLNERNQALLQQSMVLIQDLRDSLVGRPAESEYVYENPKAASTGIKRQSGIDFRT